MISRRFCLKRKGYWGVVVGGELFLGIKASTCFPHSEQFLGEMSFLLVPKIQLFYLWDHYGLNITSQMFVSAKICESKAIRLRKQSRNPGKIT